MFIGLSPIGLLVMLLGPFTSFGFSLINVNVQSLISLESKADEQGVVLGVSQSFASLARVIGPLVGGAIATFNIGLPYVVSGIVSLLILAGGQRYLHHMRAARRPTK